MRSASLPASIVPVSTFSALAGLTVAAFNASNGVAIVGLVERFRLPAVYTYRQLAIDGGLMAYGPDTFAAFHQTADYVDRVLRGEEARGTIKLGRGRTSVLDAGELARRGG